MRGRLVPPCLLAGLALAMPALAKPPAKTTAAPAAQAAPAASRPAPVRVTTVEGITEYRLHNGLRVLLFPDPSKPTITVNITYVVGSRHENYGETGMAHLLEHLMFKGTPRHANIPQELTSHGARPNGSTWFDRTNYFETFAATDENLEWALDLEADRMVNSFIAKKDLDSEMTVVRNEFEAGENEPLSILEERTLSTAFLWHNYGNSTIGARADLENVPIERLQAFWRTYYQPDNAVLLVAGKFDEAKTLALVDRFFGAIPRPARALPVTYTAEPTQDGERSVALRRVGDVQGLSVVYHVPAASHPDSAAVATLVEILAARPSGRLYKALVETKKAATISGYTVPLREPGYVALSAEVLKEASLDDARAAMLGVLDAFAKVPVTEDELNRARTALLNQVEQTTKHSDRLGMRMSESIAAGDWRLFFIHRDRLRALTVADVQKAALAYLKPSNRTIGTFHPTDAPDRAEIPAGPAIEQLVKDYKGDQNVTAGEAFDPSPANIEARTRRTTIEGGLELALLPKKTRNGAVSAMLTLRSGDEKSLAGQAWPAGFAVQLLNRGTTKHTRHQLKEEFDRLKATVFIGGGAAQQVARIETVRENLPAVLTLVAEMLREPAFPVNEFEQLKQETLAETEQQKSDPRALAAIEIERHLAPYAKDDPRYTGTPDEDIAGIKATTLEQVKAFHAEFIGASTGQMAIVGDFDAEATEKLVATLFGNWAARRPFARLVNPYRAIPAVNRSIETPDKTNAVFAAGLLLELRDDDPDYPALLLGNYMIGGGFLNSRLATRIRQKEGLSYGVGSQFSAGSLDRNGRFGAFAIYAPQNAARLEAAFKEEIARVLETGFTEQEVRDAKSGLLQNRQIGRAQDAALASNLAAYLFLDRTLAWDAALEQKVAALTPESIREALRRHLAVDRITIVKAGDFAKAAKAAPAAAAATSK